MAPASDTISIICHPPSPTVTGRHPSPRRVVYRLLLTYKFTATEAGKYRPTVPLLNE
jgi:hypothetical protein